MASDDPLWKLMQAHEDVPYRVSCMEEDIYDAWSRTPGAEPSCNPNQTGFLHADRLLMLSKILTERPLISQPALIELGHQVGVRDQAFRKVYEEAQRKRKRRKHSKHNGELGASSQNQMADNFAKKASATDTLREMQQELDATLARLNRDEDDQQKSTIDQSPSTQPQVKRFSHLAATSPLARIRIGSSASSKLNYIISEVRKHLCLNQLQYLPFPLLGSTIFSGRKDPHFLRICANSGPRLRSTRTDSCQVPPIYNPNCVSRT